MCCRLRVTVTPLQYHFRKFFALCIKGDAKADAAADNDDHACEQPAKLHGEQVFGRTNNTACLPGAKQGEPGKQYDKQYIAKCKSLSQGIIQHAANQRYQAAADDNRWYIDNG